MSRSSITSLLVILSLVSLLSMLFITGCADSQQTADVSLEEVGFFKVGHRGARGLMPENTIPSFKKAIEVGANTIEFDVHITKDEKVVIYHDNSFTPEYTTKPDGSDIAEDEREMYTFYQMDYVDIKEFIVGEKPYPAFPEQERLKSYAPLLTEMIAKIEKFTDKHEEYDPVIYLLEVKSNPNADGFAQPDPETFMEIMMSRIEPYLDDIEGRLIIQSFDIRPLKVLQRTHPDIPLGFLTGDKGKTIADNIEEMGFTPQYYNPNFALVNRDLLEEAHERGLKVFPWTVQKKDKMKELQKMGVDGIITDYPDRLEEVMENEYDRE